MKRPSYLALVLMFVSGQVVLAQAPQQTPKPGPEVKRLGYFAGNWSTEGETKQSLFGPAGKFNGSDHNEWFTGGFFLVLHSEAKGPMGEMKGLSLMGYNAAEQVYTYNGFDNMGTAESAKGTVRGDTWDWTSESKMGGKAVKSRYTIKELSPTSYSFKWEASVDGGPWSTIMEGKSTKTK